MTHRIAILGAGPHAREVRDVIEAVNAVRSTYRFEGYLVEPAYGNPGEDVHGHPILGDVDWLRDQEVLAVAGVGAPEIKRKLVARAEEVGACFATLIHPAASLTPHVQLGRGVVIAAHCVLTSNIVVGDHVHLNLACTVSHDGVLEEYAYLSPGVHLAGRVTVGEGSNIGIGANVIQDVRVGRWSIVGAGAAVLQDVPDNTTVVGVPGRVAKRRAPGWHRG
jgi:sugar O-acyltransferase (sialic acid O-acetyltransferase NeuD family)